MPDGGTIGLATGGITGPLISGGVGGVIGRTLSRLIGCTGGETIGGAVITGTFAGGIVTTAGDAALPFTIGFRDAVGTAGFAGAGAMGRVGAMCLLSDWHPMASAPSTRANEYFRASCVMGNPR